MLVVAQRTGIIIAVHKLHGIHDESYDTLWIGIKWARRLQRNDGWCGVLRRPSSAKIEQLEAIVRDIMAGTTVDGERVAAQTYATRRIAVGKMQWTLALGIPFGRALFRPITDSLQDNSDGWVPTSRAVVRAWRRCCWEVRSLWAG